MGGRDVTRVVALPVFALSRQLVDQFPGTFIDFWIEMSTLGILKSLFRGVRCCKKNVFV